MITLSSLLGSSYISDLVTKTTVLDDITNYANGEKRSFDLTFEGSFVEVFQPQDLQVVINGKILTPDISLTNYSYPWILVSYAGGGGKAYKITNNNKLSLYNPPKTGDSIYLTYRPSQLTTYTSKNYAFSAMTIALGD